MKIKKLQRWCYELEKSTGERNTMELLGEFAQEFGEAVRSILAQEGIKVRRNEDNIAKELFDLFYNLSVIASKHDLDLESVFEITIRKYEKRFNANIWDNLNEYRKTNNKKTRERCLYKFRRD